jgi:hypothetical protein
MVDKILLFILQSIVITTKKLPQESIIPLRDQLLVRYCWVVSLEGSNRFNIYGSAFIIIQYSLCLPPRSHDAVALFCWSALLIGKNTTHFPHTNFASPNKFPPSRSHNGVLLFEMLPYNNMWIKTLGKSLSIW